MNFNHEELMLMMLYNTGTRMGLVHELRLMQCYLMPDETALRELSEGVIEKPPRILWMLLFYTMAPWCQRSFMCTPSC